MIAPYESDSVMPVVSAIVVSYNTREMTLECLRALEAETRGLAAEIFVVDNASSDGSAAAVREAFPAVTVIANERNAGFGAANNLAFRRARGRYLLLLNTDAFLPTDALNTLIAFLASQPTVGIVGPRLLNGDRSRQCSCYHYPTPLRAWLDNLRLGTFFPAGSRLGDYRRWDHMEERDVDFVAGACLLVRREVYDAIGGFDERFFMYQEETDWQLRARQAGWRTVFTPMVEVVHLGGASGWTDQPRVNHHFFESLDKYQLKHHGLAGFLSVRAAMLVGCSLRAIYWLLRAAAPAMRRRALNRARWLAWLFFRQASAGLPTVSPS